MRTQDSSQFVSPGKNKSYDEGQDMPEEHAT